MMVGDAATVARLSALGLRALASRRHRDLLNVRGSLITLAICCAVDVVVVDTGVLSVVVILGLVMVGLVQSLLVALSVVAVHSSALRL